MTMEPCEQTFVKQQLNNYGMCSMPFLNLRWSATSP